MKATPAGHGMFTSRWLAVGATAVMLTSVALAGVASAPPALGTSAAPGLYAWGADGATTAFAAGPCGTGGAGCLTPVPVSLPNGVTAKAVMGGSDMAIAIGSDGNLYEWNDQYGPFPIPSYCTIMTYAVSAPASLICRLSMPQASVHPISVSVGTYYFLVLGSDHNVYSWGHENPGALGTVSSTDNFGPSVEQVQLPAGVVATDVSASRSFALALDSKGEIYGWGHNFAGQLGPNATLGVQYATPILISGFAARAIATGDGAFALAIGSDNNVYAWGDNANGELGNGQVLDGLGCNCNPTPSEIDMTGMGSGQAMGISAGVVAGFAIAQNGTAWAWGYDGTGALGNVLPADYPPFGEVPTPTEVLLPPGVSASSISSEDCDQCAGDHWTTAVGSDGVYSWGNEGTDGVGAGSLGNGTPDGSYTPVQVSLPSGLVPVSATTSGPTGVALLRLPGLAITTVGLFDASVGAPYSAPLSATDGNPPYKWAIASGKLPKGLHLNKHTGVISGTPKRTARSSTFTVKVVDTKTKIKPHTQNMATEVFSLTVS